MKVILCGYHWIGCKVLEELLGEGHEVFVFTHESPYHVPSLINYCKQMNVPYSTENISKVTLPFKPDIICSIYYRYIIKKHVIDICGGAIFNLHPALLPKYRGCSSLTWALINGEKEVGFTYHYVDEGCDTGNIILQKEIQLENWDTNLSIYYRVMYESYKYFKEAFNLVSQGYSGTEQIGEASYYKRGCPHDGKIDTSWTMSYIERFIRSQYFPPYPPASFNEKNIYTLNEYEEELKNYTLSN